MPLTADPLTAANDAVAEILGATPAPKRRGTLLVVDDEDGPRQSLRVIFKDDYDLLMAEDGPTAIETTDTIRQALRLRACDYINKPFDLATMRDAVNQAMQRRILEGEIHSSAEKVQQLLT